MNREILFRGKRIDSGEWIEGYAAQSGGAFIILDNGLTYGGFEVFEVNSATIGQFTGLTDKNGQKIFEGDVLCVDDTKDETYGEFPHVFGFVKFGEYKVDYTENIGFYVDWLDNWYGDFSKDYRKDLCYWINICQGCEVRGNIHDNPELLEVQG